MTEFSEHVLQLPGAEAIDADWLTTYRDEMLAAIPEIADVEERQRFLAVETRLYPDGYRGSEIGRS